MATGDKGQRVTLPQSVGTSQNAAGSTREQQMADPTSANPNVAAGDGAGSTPHTPQVRGEGAAEPARAAPEAPVMVTSPYTGVQVPADEFVVLHTRLGRSQVELPKINPNDATEPVKYHVPEAFQRGQRITLADIPTGAPSADETNLQRLFRLGAIGRLDHPDALEAIRAYEDLREAEKRALMDRNTATLPSPAVTVA